MFRFVLLTAVFIVVFAGCGSARVTGEREAFRLSHVPDSHKSGYLRANSLINSGDYYLNEGLAAPEKKNKVKCLTTAAGKYGKALDILKEILAEVTDDTDREFITHVIEDTQSSLEEAVHSIPILD